MRPRTLLAALFAAFAGLVTSARGEVAIPNQAPYLSTYYIEPRVNAAEEAVIRYYVTDFFQKEYLTDDASERFTIAYWVNGERHAVSNVAPGDNSLNLGVLPEGKVLFALQATDSRQNKSHRLYQEFRVVDPVAAAIPPEKILFPNLASFNISSNDTDPVATTAGLNALLKWAGTNGFRKVVLPRGRYRIDESVTLQMVTGLILDMNGSTFKLNPNARGSCLMLEFVDCHDSHVTNGIFEGDLYEHDFTNAPNNSEWVNAMSISQGSEYSSVEDVTVRNFPGYGTCSTHRHTYNTAKAIGNNFVPFDVDGGGGNVASAIRVTNTNRIDIQAFINSYGFIQLGLYLGYQGNPAGSWVYKAHFYDAGTNYLESIEGYMYRRLYPPPNAKFARFTLYSTNQPAGLEVYNFRAPYNCAYKNIRHENIRCVGMALSGMDNFLVEGCRFDNCGWAAANCAFDAEDGWDLMHDLTFRNNVFGANPANEYLTCAGHNFIMTNNVMKTYVWDRTRSYVFRNNTLKSGTYLFGKNDRTGYVRISDNTYGGVAKLQMSSASPDRAYCARNERCPYGVATSPDGSTFFYKSAISGGAVNGKAVACAIDNVTNSGGVFEIYDSAVNNSLLKSSGYKVLATVAGCTISNSHCITQGGTMRLEGNTIVDSDCGTTGDWSDGHEYILVSNIVRTALPYLVYVGNSYKQVVLLNNTITSTHTNFFAIQLWNPTQSNLFNQVVECRDNIFRAQGGYVVKADRLPNAACLLTVRLFNNVYDTIALTSGNLTNQPNVKILLAPNLPPAVSLTGPANGAVFLQGAPIPLAATATDTDGAVTNVFFYTGATLLGSDTNPPYGLVWSSAPVGSLSLTAVAADDAGAEGTSAVAVITVLPAPVSGYATNYWTNAAGGPFESAGNWSNSLAPGPLDVAVFNLTNAAYTVTWAAGTTSRYVSVQKGSLVWDLRGNTYAYTPSNNFSLTAGAPVALTISNGVFAITDATKDHYLTLSAGGTQHVAAVRVINAVVRSSRLFIGSAANDRISLSVDGPDSRWYEPFGGYCNWGGGTGSRTTVTVTNGACIRLGGNLNFGCSSGARALIAVTGAGSSFTNGGFSMPYGLYSPPATATVSVADGGLVACTAGTTLRSNGTVSLNNGSFLNSTTNLALDVFRGAVVEGSGLIRARIRNMGVLRPGGLNAIGTLTVTGDVYNADAALATNGTIQIELAGAGQGDRLSVQGQLRACGVLAVSLINGYRPSGGARFRILDFRAVTGEFAAVELPGDPGRWDLGSLYRSGEIRFQPAGALILLR